MKKGQVTCPQCKALYLIKIIGFSLNYRQQTTLGIDLFDRVDWVEIGDVELHVLGYEAAYGHSCSESKKS